MSSNEFVHLHTHSDYSMLLSACSIKKLAHKAEEFQMPAMALTDYGTISGAIDFYKTLTAKNIKPITGCQFYVATGNHLDKTSTQERPSGYQIFTLAKTFVGYQNLCRLNAASHLKGFYYKPRVDKDLFDQYKEGLIAVSPCAGGEAFVAIKNGDEKRAIDVLAGYKDLFGAENFYLEIQNHGYAEQQKIVGKLIKIAKDLNIPLVATNDVHYIEQEHAKAHEILMCIGSKKTLNDDKRFRFQSDQYYMKSPEQMIELFKDYPDAIKNTLVISEQCNVKLKLNCENHYPIYDVGSETTQKDYLRNVCMQNLPARYNFKADDKEFTEQQKKVLDRIDYELAVIEKAGYSSYFLVVWDFLDDARKKGIPIGPGRGSGAGSIIAYLTYITDIDPLRYTLLFERFLNPDRVSPPDFDIDICERRRYEVIEYVRQKYGEDRVAQIGTFGTLKTKAVIKDVARVFGYHFSDSDRITKLLPNDPSLTLKKAFDVPEFKALVESEEWVGQIIEYSKILEGLNRNNSIHAAGVIIGDQVLTNIIALSRGQNEGESVTQNSGGPCEELGLLKMDFLGLRTLTIIQDCLDLIKESHGLEIKDADIPLGDEKTIQLLNKGNTIAVFQLESGGMRDLCKRFKITRLEDIIALIALYRPGPMQFLDEFIGRKMGLKELDYDVPEMEPILKETYGIMLYQEQVMQVVQAVGGFTLAESDIMRRAMGKKKQDVMEKMLADFIKGAVANGHTEKIATTIWEKILMFAGYGFNKSHSAAYAMLSYRTAYLKANYPVDFMAAVLSSELGNNEKISILIHECRKMNIKILPPNVNKSIINFSGDGQNIRFGLGAIKGVGSSAAEAILAARKEHGEFKSLLDFCEKYTKGKINRRVLESLIKCGAFDSFGDNRSSSFEVIDAVISRAQSTAQDRASGQGSLFDMLSEDDLSESPMDFKIPELPEWQENVMLAYEKELLGFYASGHPLDIYTETLKLYSSTSVVEMKQITKEQGVKFGGIIESLNVRASKKDGRPWAIIVLEDLEDSIDILCFGDTYAVCKNALSANAPIFIEAMVSRNENDELKVIAQNILSMADVCSAHTKEMHIRIQETKTTKEQLEQLKSLILERNNDVNAFEKAQLIKKSLKLIKDKEIKNNFNKYLQETLYSLENISQIDSFLKNENFSKIHGDNPLCSSEERLKIQKFFRQIKAKILMILSITCADGKIAFIELGMKYKTNLTEEMIGKIKDIFGENCYHPIPDESLPERKSYYKKFEKQK